MTKALPYLWYPLLFGAALAAFGAMLSAGSPLAVATYTPIAVAALLIVVLELVFPERLDWRPTSADIAADAAFMAFVQILLPRALAMLAVLAIAAWMHEHAPSRWWPQSWPIAGQVLAMVLAVDLLRYWVHRACHTWTPLWRLHEVHHSPDILYTLNVGRFHPLEKLLHFSCDTVPFLLLGVAPEVIAGYFVVYAVNGFFQHSNVRLRYGWLNYVVGSAETHRWHHARDARKAHCNFGNSTLVWDVVFSTWRLPSEALDIGITDRGYPRGFWAQMMAPFRRQMPMPRRSAARRVADFAVPLHLRILRLMHGMRVGRAVRDPMRAQQAVLARILRDNAATTFGRRYGFERIASYADYVKAVPVMDFEALRPFADAEVRRGEAALTREPPLRYLRTSGSTGQPKDIPLTRTHLEALRRIQRTSVVFQHRACPEAFAGSILAITSPADEGRLANGKPYGAASGIVGASTPSLVREKFVLPAEVLAMADPLAKYLLILRLAAARDDITYFGSANSTTPLALMKLYREHQIQLVQDIGAGGFSFGAPLPQELRRALGARLRPDPQRADALSRIAKQAGTPRMAELWPGLRMVVTWTGGSAGVTVKALRQELDPHTRIFELGYLASEFRATITLGRRAGTGLPTLDTHFFEFVERERWDRGEPEYLTLAELRKGDEYYVIVTTPSGLYRYFINDLVRVTGRLHRTPLLRFLQKGKGVTNITGEKLYEAQVLAAVDAAMTKLGLVARFVMMLADEQSRSYRLYVEPDRCPGAGTAVLSAEVDAQLKKLNVEYESKRESGRLSAPRAAWLRPEAGEAYKRHCVTAGQREGQFKSVALAYAGPFGFDLESLVRAA